MSEVTEHNDNNSRRKEGRTILISNDENIEAKFDGIQDIHITNNGSRFIVFDTLENSVKAYNFLKENNVKVKYSYYKLFFRIKNMNLENMEYNILKEIISKYLEKELGVNILYFKFYTKNKQLMGSGDLTTDTKASFDKLINLNDIVIDEETKSTISFFRFKIKTNVQKPINQQEQLSTP